MKLKKKLISHKIIYKRTKVDVKRGQPVKLDLIK